MKLAHPACAGESVAFRPRRTDELTAQSLKETLALWQRRCPPAAALPAIADFDILDYHRVVGCLNLVEVREPPLDFVFRVHAATGADYIGRDMTGRSVWDYPDPHYAAFVHQALRRARVEKCAQVVIEDVFVRSRYMSYDVLHRWEAVLLPLSGGDGQVARLLFAFDLQRAG